MISSNFISTGTVAVLTVYILKIPSLNTKDIAVALEWMFYIFIPNFCFANGLQEIYNNYQAAHRCGMYEDLALDRGSSLEEACEVLKSFNTSESQMICCPQKGKCTNKFYAFENFILFLGFPRNYLRIAIGTLLHWYSTDTMINSIGKYFIYFW